jgi:peroxiredoxin
MKVLSAACRKLPFNSRAYWLVLTLAALVCIPNCHPDQSATRVPDFTLPQVQGGVFHLRSGRSQPVLVAFLQTAPDTADTTSRQQVGFLLSMHHQYGAPGLKVVIVDSSALVTRQAPKHDALINASYDWQLDIPLLEDEDNRVARNWGVTQVPTLMLLASDGSIVQRWHGLTGPAVLAQGIEELSRQSGRAGDLAP